MVLYTLPLIAGGIQRGLDKINGWLLPIYCAGLLTAVIWASIVLPGGSSWLAHFTAPSPFTAGGPGWLATRAAFMGVWILMTYTVDFASLGNAKDVKVHQQYTFGWLFYTLAFGANSPNRRLPDLHHAGSTGHGDRSSRLARPAHGPAGHLRFAGPYQHRELCPGTSNVKEFASRHRV